LPGLRCPFNVAAMAGQRVVPMFSYEDVGRAADWIAKAFGFEETGRWSDESGRVTHVNMELARVSDTSRSSSPAREAVTLWRGFAAHSDLFPRPTAWCQTLSRQCDGRSTGNAALAERYERLS
jgi:uncharacterized glyoxalase superfamily protein PhnB